jgi:hypothetical protein
MTYYTPRPSDVDYSRIIVIAYWDVHNRGPTDVELDYWQLRMEGGCTEACMRETLIRSQLYKEENRK